MTTATVINDEEPTPDAMDRLWAALDVALDPQSPEWAPPAPRGTAGTHECLRCGYKWTPRTRGDPKSCANPECRSAYWNVPPARPHARKPGATDWSKVRAKMGSERVRRRKQRHLAKVKELARELGLDITDPRTGRTLIGTRTNATVLAETLTGDPRMTQQRSAPSTAAAMSPPPEFRRRTVPPPPGMDDLDTTNDTKGSTT